MLKYGKSWYEYELLPKELHFSKELYDKLWDLRPDKPGIVKLFGKEFNTHHNLYK